MYMMWFDDNNKKPVERKIDEAVAAYMRHFKTRPNVVLVNEADHIDLPGIRVRVAGYVQRNNFWVGWEDAATLNVMAQAATTGTR
ncbi:MAG: hypothetical protein C0183_08605 [Roseiflexus castenholzii]|uniref:hypothetical protein n=1 Tax=Roseiflexus castenholzii TaxID=120962 RepID=UPI000CC14B7C|nr:MAG: hypothetical protein C0183_08605 [Roseiflexus castenholzii]